LVAAIKNKFASYDALIIVFYYFSCEWLIYFKLNTKNFLSEGLLQDALTHLSTIDYAAAFGILTYYESNLPFLEVCAVGEVSNLMLPAYARYI
jgi:hypothetical protein